MHFFVNFDLVGHNFNFKLPDGNEYYKTCTGGFCSLFLVLILLAYSAATGVQFFTRDSYTMIKREFEGVYLDSNYTFGYEDGFAVAIGFWLNTEGYEHEFNTKGDNDEVGQIKFVEKYWETQDENVKFRELKSRLCTEEDFQVPQGKSRSSYGFFPPNPDTQTLRDSLEELLCID